MNKRPVIGITKPDRKDRFAYGCIWLSVWLAGGKPLMITPRNAKMIGKIDGLILGGGKDVFPALFQDEQKPKSDYHYDHDRDEMELYWLRKAEGARLPIMGICRGAQLINVAGGGSLHMDMKAVYQQADYPQALFSHIFFRKKISVTPDSHMHRITGQTTLRVNSIHEQSINDVAPGFYVTAREDNGVIQAVEKADYPFLIGVQFHPEFLIYQRRFRAFFRALTFEASQSLKTKR